MELILLAIIFIQFAYSAYRDNLFYKEREKLQLKLMSKDVHEYTAAVEEPEPTVVAKKEDEYLPIEDVSIDRIVKAKELL